MSVLEELKVGAPSPQLALEEIKPSEVVWPPEEPSDLAALKLVVQDARQAEAHQEATGLPAIWNRNERLYQFQVPIQFWEGTKTPRAHLGVPLVYEHVESTLPQIMAGLFSEWPPFDVEPLPGTSMDAARAKKALLGWALRETEFEEEARLVMKQALIQTVGVGKWGWKQEVRPIKRVQRAVPDILLGDGTRIPQEGSDELEEVVEEIEVNRPFFEWVERRNLLIDPSLTRPDIRKAKFVIHRIYMTIEQLDALRDVPGYKIPTREKLQKLMFPPKETPPQNPFERSQQLNITSEFNVRSETRQASVDPLTTPLEVLEYWTPTKLIVVVQRKLVIRNENNPYGRIPFVSIVFTDLPGQFDGLGIASIIGGEQRLQQGIINTRLDDLALRLHGTFMRVRGTNTPTQQLRLRPGGIIDTDTPDGVALMKREPAIPDAFAEVEASDRRAQRRTGANEFVTQGGIGQRTSITRTATGVATLAAGTGARMQYFMDNFGRNVFVPTLEAFSEMMSRWMKPSQVERLLTDELGEAFTGDPVAINNARMRFRMLASTKLAARQNLAQNLPLLLQHLLNADIINALASQGKKVNISELTKMVFDVSGWPNIQNVIEDMSEDEIAQRQAESEASIAQQQAALSGENQLRAIEAKAEAQTVRDITSKLIEAQLGDAAKRQGGRVEVP